MINQCPIRHLMMSDCAVSTNTHSSHGTFIGRHTYIHTFPIPSVGGHRKERLDGQNECGDSTLICGLFPSMGHRFPLSGLDLWCGRPHIVIPYLLWCKCTNLWLDVSGVNGF